MKEKILLIFGGKSTAIEIYEVAKTHYKHVFDKCIYVIGDNEIKGNDNSISDSEVQDFVVNKSCNYIISFANHKLRNKIEALMTKLSIQAINVIHPSSIISETSSLGVGNYVAGNVVISSYSNIGNHNMINYNTTVGHDTNLENHIIINPGVRVSGNVTIHSNVLVGANSFIFQGKTIGSETLIDAMTYVDRDIGDRMICSSKQLNVFKRVIF